MSKSYGDEDINQESILEASDMFNFASIPKKVPLRKVSNYN